MHAKGTFEVKMAPQPPQDGVGDASIGRMGLDKQYSGDLEATAPEALHEVHPRLTICDGAVTFEA